MTSLLVGAYVFVRRAKLAPYRRLAFGGIVAGLVVLQAAWDFGGGFYKF